MLEDLSFLNKACLSRLNRFGISSIRDLCFYRPVKYVDRTSKDVCSAVGTVITVVVKVDVHFPPRGKRFPYRVLCKTFEHCLTLVFFNYSIPCLRSQLPVNSMVLVSGKLSNDRCIIHPDYIGNPDKLSDLAIFEPVYRKISGISNVVLRKCINITLDLIKEKEEWIPQDVLSRLNWVSWKQSIIAIHSGVSEDVINKAVERMAYEELSAHLLRLKKLRNSIMESEGQSISGDGKLRDFVMKHLGFQLTQGQSNALSNIYQEQASHIRMIKLIQGDVGCGKTLVAFMAILNVVECGCQAAFMAPTEVLAKQHYDWFCKCVSGKLDIALITASVSKRKAILEGLASNKINILVGTHALLNDDVKFQKLMLVVIDEQQRFGVEQRAKLIAKGRYADVLMMSATPIPRSFNMVINGSLEVVKINDKPQGRKTIHTSVYPIDRVDEMISRIKKGHHKVYWICPLIDESEGKELQDTQRRFQYLSNFLEPSRLGIIHGKTSSKEKEQVLDAFRRSKDMVLVATTVIEVGLDVKDANIIVIENAERFGLAQLHQLRGRVGRGDSQSYCVLLYGYIQNKSCERLKILKECDDGFELAERDLMLRGGGDMVGVKQSGWPRFWFFDPFKHSHLYKLVNIDATAARPDFAEVLSIFARKEKN